MPGFGSNLATRSNMVKVNVCVTTPDLIKYKSHPEAEKKNVNGAFSKLKHRQTETQGKTALVIARWTSINTLAKEQMLGGPWFAVWTAAVFPIK